MLTAEIRPDGIAMLRLDQPERRNALSIAMRDAISDTLEAWTTDDRNRPTLAPMDSPGCRMTSPETAEVS